MDKVNDLMKRKSKESPSAREFSADSCAYLEGLNSDIIYGLIQPHFFYNFRWQKWFVLKLLATSNTQTRFKHVRSRMSFLFRRGSCFLYDCLFKDTIHQLYWYELASVRILNLCTVYMDATLTDPYSLGAEQGALLLRIKTVFPALALQKDSWLG